MKGRRRPRGTARGGIDRGARRLHADGRSSGSRARVHCDLMRPLFVLALASALRLHACEEQLSGDSEGADPAPSPPGPHSGALLTVGGRPVELVARTDGTLEVYGVSAGPQALGSDWPVSAEVSLSGGASRVVAFRYRPEASRYEAAAPGAQGGAFRVGYIADGKTQVAEGAITQLLPPGPPIPEPTLVDATPIAEASPDADAGAGSAEEPSSAAPAPAPSADSTPAEASTETATPPARSSRMRQAARETRSSGRQPRSRRANRR